MAQSLESLLGRDRWNAALCWGLLGVVFLVVGFDLWRGGYVVAVLGIAVAAAVLAPSIALRAPRVMIPWEVVFVATAALVARVVFPWQPVEFLGAYLVIAAIALVIAVEIHVYTRVEMNRPFTTVFVAMVTMTAATAWTLGRWTLDLTAGTTFIPSNDALMWELIAATTAGVGAGILFDRYFRRYSPEDIRPSGYDSPDEHTPGDGESPALREHREPTLSERLGLSEHRQRQFIRILQAGLVAVAIVGVVQLDIAIVLTASAALSVTFVPATLTREYDVPMDVGLTLWITTAVFLHSLGTMYFYGDFLWWHNLTHAVSGSLVAGIGYALFRAVDEYTAAVRFPSRFMFVLILLFVVSVGVAWEILEFATDRVALALGYEDEVLAQHGLADTMTDMVFNVVGALVVATWGTAYLTGVAAGIREQLHGE